MAESDVRVEESPTCGRKLVATSKFPPGRCILKDSEPYAYTLFDNKRETYCDFCLSKCSQNSTLKKCPGCKYVSYCKEASCQNEDWKRLHKYYCKTLKKNTDRHSIHLLSQFTRKQGTGDDEDGFPTTIDQLEHHHEKLSSEIKTWLGTIKPHVEGDDRRDSITKERFLKMYGAYSCNSFKIYDHDLIGIAEGVYLRASMVNHSCDPNCVVVFDGRKLQLRTIKDVEKDEECTISYVDVIAPATERRDKLEWKYHFTCKCVKCQKEIKASGPDDEELRKLQTSNDQMKEPMQEAEKSGDWTKVFQKLEHFLKPCSALPAHHYLLVKIRIAAFATCMKRKSFEKAAEFGKLVKESYEHHYGKYEPLLGLHLLMMGEIQQYQERLSFKERLDEARKYLIQSEEVLEVTHGLNHPLTKSVKMLLQRCTFPLGHSSCLILTDHYQDSM